MIAVDTNILVYAHRGDSRFHDQAAEAVRSLAEAKSSWAIPSTSLHEFLAIVTHPKIYSPPSPVDAAFTQVEAWLDSPSLVVLHEGAQHWTKLREAAESGAIGARIHDGRVYAVCADAGVTELWSADRDFSRFPITVRNPLIA
jgi:hypothetical protein